jgi:hypothetical protein
MARRAVTRPPAAAAAVRHLAVLAERRRGKGTRGWLKSAQVREQATHQQHVMRRAAVPVSVHGAHQPCGKCGHQGSRALARTSCQAAGITAKPFRRGTGTCGRRSTDEDDLAVFVISLSIIDLALPIALALHPWSQQGNAGICRLGRFMTAKVRRAKALDQEPGSYPGSRPPAQSRPSSAEISVAPGPGR